MSPVLAIGLGVIAVGIILALIFVEAAGWIGDWIEGRRR